MKQSIESFVKYNNIIYFDFSQCLKFISKLKGILMYNTYIILKG